MRARHQLRTQTRTGLLVLCLSNVEGTVLTRSTCSSCASLCDRSWCGRGQDTSAPTIFVCKHCVHETELQLRDKPKGRARVPVAPPQVSRESTVCRKASIVLSSPEALATSDTLPARLARTTTLRHPCSCPRRPRRTSSSPLPRRRRCIAEAREDARRRRRRKRRRPPVRGRSFARPAGRQVQLTQSVDLIADLSPPLSLSLCVSLPVSQPAAELVPVHILSSLDVGRGTDSAQDHHRLFACSCGEEANGLERWPPEEERAWLTPLTALTAWALGVPSRRSVFGIWKLR